MTLLFSMLPFYLLGNLHCMGMCGPLALLIGQHPRRALYLLGRLISFTLAGGLAGSMGAVISVVLQQLHIPAVSCLLFGGGLAVWGLARLVHFPLPHLPGAASVNQLLGRLLSRQGAWPIFLFGFCTVLLPCGQSLIVFAACAVSGDPLVGLLNGFVFALLTSPALVLAMKAKTLFAAAKRHANTLMAVLAVVVGLLSLARGLAEIGVLPHVSWSPDGSEKYHLALF